MEIVGNDLAVYAWNKKYKVSNKQYFIYTITCLCNGKVYVGRTVNPKARLKEHTYSLNVGHHQNAELQKDFDRFGTENFVFQIHTIAGRFDNAEENYMRKFHSYDPRYGYNKDMVAKKLRQIPTLMTEVELA